MADITTIQVAKDDADALIVKLTRTNSDTSQESHVEKVNAAALACAASFLAFDGNTAGVGPVGFVPGETLVGNTSGATAIVVNYHPESNNFYVVGVNGTFSNAEVVTGQMSHNSVTTANNPVTAAGHTLDLESIWYSIAEGAEVVIEWEGSLVQNANLANSAAAYSQAVALHENGYFGKNALAALFSGSRNANTDGVSNSTFTFTPNGSISVSTVGLVANGGYTIVLELRKGDGYSVIPDERFRDR